jgi:hypothetical protein
MSLSARGRQRFVADGRGAHSRCPRSAGGYPSFLHDPEVDICAALVRASRVAGQRGSSAADAPVRRASGTASAGYGASVPGRLSRRPAGCSRWGGSQLRSSGATMLGPATSPTSISPSTRPRRAISEPRRRRDRRRDHMFGACDAGIADARRHQPAPQLPGQRGDGRSLRQPAQPPRRLPGAPASIYTTPRHQLVVVAIRSSDPEPGGGRQGSRASTSTRPPPGTARTSATACQPMPATSWSPR